MVDNRGPQLQAVVSTFVSLAFVATMLRVWVRLRIVKAFGLDDWFMVVATLFHIMFATCAIGGIHYGTGRHMWDLDREGIYNAMRYWWLCYVAYCWSMIFAKLSIGVFLLRVTVTKMHRWTIYTVMTLTCFTGLVFFFVTLLQCSPISFFWNKWQNGTCINVDIIIALTFLYSVISAVCDFTFGILPIFLVLNLNMSKNAKIALIPILSMACIASTAVLVRMGYVMDFKSNDFLYKTVDIAIWSDIEQGLGITAGSLATLRPLYRIIAKRIGLTHTDTNPMKRSGGTPGATQEKGLGYGGSSSRGNKKRPSQFSMISFTKHDNGSDEEYGLGNTKPIPLPDIENDRAKDIHGSGAESDYKGFNTWKVQPSGNSSEEELNKKEIRTLGLNGITRQTDVYQSSERIPSDRRH